MSRSEPDKGIVNLFLTLPGTESLRTHWLGKKIKERPISDSTNSLSEAIAIDAGPDIPIVKADEFIAALLPEVPVTDTIVGTIVSWIEACPKYYTDRCWQGFPENPVKAEETEDVISTRLSVVFDAILAAVAVLVPEIVARHTIAYIENTTKPLETMFLSNAYFFFRNKFSGDDENPHWMDIAVTGNFRKGINLDATESVCQSRSLCGPHLLNWTSRTSRKCSETCNDCYARIRDDESASGSQL